MTRPPPLLLAGLLALALFLRLQALPGLWLDEAYSVDVAQAGVAASYAQMKIEFHPPLWHWVLLAFLRLFGDGELAARLPSILSGCLAVWLLARIGYGWLPPGAAWVPAFLLATQAGHVAYSRETRAYALLTLFVLASSMAAVEAFRSRATNARLLFTWTIFAAAVCWTHFLGFVPVFLQGLLLLAAAAGSPEPVRQIRRVALAGLALLLACAPLLFHLARNARHGVWYMHRPQLIQYFLFPSNFLWREPQSGENLLFCLSLSFFVWITTLASLADFALHRRALADPDRRAFLAWTTLWVVPTAIIFLVSYFKQPCWNLRQTLMFQPPLLLSMTWIISSGISPFPHLRRAFLLALALCPASALPGWSDARKNWDREMMDFLRPRLAAGSKIFTWPEYEHHPVRYYLVHSPGPIPSPAPVVIPSLGYGADLARCAPGERAWLVRYCEMKDGRGASWEQSIPAGTRLTIVYREHEREILELCGNPATRGAAAGSGAESKASPRQ